MNPNRFFWILIIAIILFGLLLPDGIRAVVANNLWSVRFIKDAYAQGGVDPRSFSPPEVHRHAGMLLANQALKLGQVDLASQYIDTLIPTEDLLTLGTQGFIYYLQENYEDAFETWEKTNNSRYFSYSAGNLKGENEDLVLLAYEYAWKLAPESYDRVYFLRRLSKAKQLRETGQLEQAIQYYQVTAEQFPDFGDVYIELARAYFLNGQDELAIESIQAGWKLSMDNADYYLKAARIYQEMSLLDEALHAYQTALAIDPESEAALKGVQNLQGLDD